LPRWSQCSAACSGCWSGREMDWDRD